MPNFTLDSKISGTRITADNYLAGEALVARTGIQQYLGDELGRSDLGVVNVYRPESEVFSQDSIASYAGKPMTNDHPNELVTADNWKQHATGTIGNEILRDGEYVRVPFLLMDQSAIDDVQNGKRELSMGYTMDLLFESGTTPKGESYDAIQTNLKMNHLAVVDRGRAGKKARIGDSAQSQWGISPIKDGVRPMTVKTQTVVIDGISIETTDQGAQAIEKLQKENTSLSDSISTKDADHATALGAKDKELATKDAEIDDLKTKILDADALDAKVQARADLISTATKIAKDADFKGLDDKSIIKTAVIAVRGEDAVADKSDAYISASFDLLVEGLDSNKPDDFRSQVIDRKTPVNDDNGQDAYEKRLRDAHKQEVAK